MSTALGQHLGWRSAYWAVAVIGIVALASLALFVPHQPRGRQSGIRHELRAMGNKQVAIGLATAVVGFGGFFAVYSYLVPMLTNVTGISDSSTTLVLALYGVGMTLGTVVAGPLTDRALRPTLYAGLALLAAALVTFYFTVHSTVPALVTIAFIGAMGSLITTPVQMLLMAKAQNAPTMAAASNHSAFNLANAGGAWLGGLAISAGWGWTSPNLVGAARPGLPGPRLHGRPHGPGHPALGGGHLVACGTPDGSRSGHRGPMSACRLVAVAVTAGTSCRNCERPTGWLPASGPPH